MRVFLTGATGVIGRRAVPLFVQAGHTVTAVGRTPAKVRLLEQLGATGVIVDLFNLEALTAAVDGAEVICNLATAVPKPGVGMFFRGSWRPMDRIRTQVSANVVDAAIASGTVRRVIQESFAPVYTNQGDAWIDESAPVRPARYNRSTLDAEAAAERFTNAGGTGVVLRFGLFYGPEDAATRQLLDAVRRGWFPLPGKPDAYTTWLAHEDAASAVVAALGVPAGIYNVVEDAPMRRRELADGLAQRLGVKAPRFFPSWATWLGGALGETMARSLRISNRKFRETSDWSPRYPTMLAGLAAVDVGGSDA